MLHRASGTINIDGTCTYLYFCSQKHFSGRMSEKYLTMYLALCMKIYWKTPKGKKAMNWVTFWLLAYDKFMLLPTTPYVANALGSDSCSLTLMVTDSNGSGFIATVDKYPSALYPWIPRIECTVTLASTGQILPAWLHLPTMQCVTSAGGSHSQSAMLMATRQQQQ